VPSGSPSTLYTQKIKEVKILWDDLPLLQKETYVTQAKSAIEKYHVDIRNWQAINVDKLKQLNDSHKPELESLSKKLKRLTISTIEGNVGKSIKKSRRTKTKKLTKKFKGETKVEVNQKK